MGPMLHIGFTAALVSGAKLAGYNVSAEVIAASVIGGIFLDADKVFEIVANRKKAKRGEIPDITARCRILHIPRGSGWLIPFPKNHGQKLLLAGR